jgi:sec-independent protein translocase protein TatA
MQGLSIGHIIVIALVVLVLFGRGKVSSLMGEFGKGINAFKKGIGESTDTPAKPEDGAITTAESKPKPAEKTES